MWSVRRRHGGVEGLFSKLTPFDVHCMWHLLPFGESGQKSGEMEVPRMNIGGLRSKRYQTCTYNVQLYFLSSPI